MGVFSAWAVAVGLQVFRDVRQGVVPLPSEFVASGAVFGALALVGQIPDAEGFAGALAWGYLVALALEAGPKALVNATNPSLQTQTTPGAQGKSGFSKASGQAGGGSGGGGGGSW